MCFTADHNSVFKIAEEDITVYKWLIPKDEETALSPIKNYEYTLNTLYETIMKAKVTRRVGFNKWKQMSILDTVEKWISIEDITDVPVRKQLLDGKKVWKYEIFEGFHSFNSMEFDELDKTWWSKKDVRCKLYKCKIPVGSIYIQNKTETVSNKIIVIERV